MKDLPTGVFEEELRRVFNGLISKEILRYALDKRALLMRDQIAPYIVGHRLADVGCGDGLIAWHLRDRVQSIDLIDVQDYLDPRVQLPLRVYRDGDRIPITEPVDTSLLLTVLHHAQNPFSLLTQTRGVTASRAIVIESICGIARSAESPESPLHGLNRDQQREYATFIDWLYNRVFHDGVPVPCNYLPPDQWQQVFLQTGWRISHSEDLGIDQCIVPEHHFLFVLDAA
jgi:hypothetical protein